MDSQVHQNLKEETNPDELEKEVDISTRIGSSHALAQCLVPDMEPNNTSLIKKTLIKIGS